MLTSDVLLVTSAVFPDGYLALSENNLICFRSTAGELNVMQIAYDKQRLNEMHNG